jgi:hypothetical protein
MSQSSEYVGLCKADSGFHFCFGEGRQMQVVWERRHTEKSVSRIPFIPSTAARLS